MAADERLVDVFPDLASELRAGLVADGDDDLAVQVDDLLITDVCRCDDSFCTSFYTGPRPDGAWGPGLRNVLPEVASGMVIVDVVDGVIRYVEVLDRATMRPAFRKLRHRVAGNHRARATNRHDHGVM